jgi:curli biogenesis system outer membrane secretion channel CsgG
MLMLRALLLVAVVAMTGCTTARNKVAYDLTDVGPVGGSLSARTVTVTTLTDGRPPDRRAARPEMGGLAVVTRDDDDWYVTTDGGYENPSVSAAVTDALVDHLRKASVFRSVEREPVPGELRLSGTLRQFDGYEDRHRGKEIAMSQFGLVGLLVGTATDVRYDATTAIDALELVDVDTGTVLWTGRVEGKVTGDHALITRSHEAPFEQANLSLKTAVAQRIDQLRQLPAPEPAIR